MSDDVEQTPSNWTGQGGMVPQQDSANDFLKEIIQAAKEREDAAKDKGMEQGQGMGR